MAEVKNGRRYLGGSTSVGLVVFTALTALAMVLEDSTRPEAAEPMIQAGLMWADLWFDADEAVKARWAEQYEELMVVAAEMADQAGAGEAI